MSAKNTLYTQLAESLKDLCFPIRSPGELRRELDEHGVGPVCAGAVCLDPDGISELLSPRDFLFTNPTQIAQVLAQRAAVALMPGASGSGNRLPR
ncbi:hypothetical protein [Deferrisoma palaeochoriense]